MLNLVTLVAIAVVAVVCWAMIGYKLRDLVRNPGNRPLRYLVITLAGLTLSMSIQPLARWLDHTLGILDLGRVLANCFALAGATSAQATLLYLTSQDELTPRRVRRRFLALLGIVAVIVVTFVLTPPPYSLSDPYVVSHAYYVATPTPSAMPYQFVFLAYLAWAALYSGVLLRRYARTAPRPLLRLGLRLMIGGCATGLVYVAVKVVASLATGSRPDLARVLDRLVVPCYMVASVALLVGATLPSWGPRIGLDRRWNTIVAWRDCRQLQPLWKLIHTAVPQVTMTPHPAEPTLRRVRMTVEILDGYVQLTPWTSAQIEDRARRRARETSDAERDAEIEAAVLVEAARSKAANEPPSPDPAVAIPMWTGALRLSCTAPLAPSG